MKKLFETPEIEVIILNTADIMFESVEDGSDPDEGEIF